MRLRLRNNFTGLFIPFQLHNSARLTMKYKFFLQNHTKDHLGDCG